MRLMNDNDEDDDEQECQCNTLNVPVWYFQALIDTLQDLVAENKELKKHLHPGLDE